ncbi:hypothetical protein ABZZ74_23615 [Streptomyces sp. NPDC006476]|uniref:hypothetical protein n=1 Tax=Streptomyces sp. NPDC006476 TaxID=3157175 RepID=UPI0033AD83C8
MSPDVYAAFLTAGDRLQSYGAWIVRNWPNLAAAIVLAVFATWCIRRACHGLGNANQRIDAALAELDNQQTRTGEK